LRTKDERDHSRNSSRTPPSTITAPVPGEDESQEKGAEPSVAYKPKTDHGPGEKIAPQSSAALPVQGNQKRSEH